VATRPAKQKASKAVRPRVGDFCAVYWLDACNYRQGEPDDAELMPCVTLGIINRCDRKLVVLSQSKFTHNDGSHTFTEVQVIPRQQVARIVVGKRNERS